MYTKESKTTEFFTSCSVLCKILKKPLLLFTALTTSMYMLPEAHQDIFWVILLHLRVNLRGTLGIFCVTPVHLCANRGAKAIIELSSILIGRYISPLRIEMLQLKSCLHYINRTSKIIAFLNSRAQRSQSLVLEVWSIVTVINL